MNESIQKLKSYLRELVEALVNEEREFDGRCKEAELDDNHLGKEHAYVVRRLGKLGDHAKIRDAHMAMFKVHRKIMRQHKVLINHALLVASQLERNELNDREVGWEVRRAQETLSQMKLEHQIIEQERRKILHDHRRIVKRLQDENQNDIIPL